MIVSFILTTLSDMC